MVSLTISLVGISTIDFILFPSVVLFMFLLTTTVNDEIALPGPSGKEVAAEAVAAALLSFL